MNQLSLSAVKLLICILAQYPILWQFDCLWCLFTLVGKKWKLLPFFKPANISHTHILIPHRSLVLFLEISVITTWLLLISCVTDKKAYNCKINIQYNTIWCIKKIILRRSLFLNFKCIYAIGKFPPGFLVEPLEGRTDHMILLPACCQTFKVALWAHEVKKCFQSCDKHNPPELHKYNMLQDST